MTTTEAIKQLQAEHDLIANEHELDGSQFAPALLEALAMAIEALKARDMTLYMNLPEVSAEEAVEILKRNNRIELLPSGKDTNVTSKDIVYRQDIEDMLQNALPSRGMWEIEGDVVKNTICETVVDLMMDLEKLPSAQPEIVRCKDCKHYGCILYSGTQFEYGECFGHEESDYTFEVKPDDFCSKAERKR